MISVAEVSGPSARESFAKVEHWLQQAMEACFALITIHDVWQQVTATMPTMKLLMIYDGDKLSAAAVTRVLEHSLGNVLEVVAIGGEDMASWFPEFHERLLSIAKASRCKYVFETGRDGWKKFLEPYGWRDAPRSLYRSVD